jgi:hypothetical protein
MLDWRSAATFALWSCCAAPAVAFGQGVDPHAVQPERPTVATHAGTVAPGWIEIETGGEFDRFGDGSHGAGASIVTKIGLGLRVQLSVIGSAIRLPDRNSLGIGDSAVGVKWRITDAAPVLGRFAIFPSIKFPTGSLSAGTGTDTTDASLLLISSHDLGPVALDINVGYTRRSGDGEIIPRDGAVWTASFGGPGVGEVGWVAEIFGFPRISGSADSTVSVLFGPTLAVRSWLIFDGGVIVPIAGPLPHAVYFGAVWNLGRAWRASDRRPRDGAPLRGTDFHEELRRRAGPDRDDPLILPTQHH